MNRPQPTTKQEDQQLIELTVILYSQTRTAIITSCMAAITVLVVAWISLPDAHPFLAAWILLLLSVNLIRDQHIQRILKAGIQRENCQRSGIIAALWALLSGLSWGMLTLLWEPQLNISAQLMIFIVMLGIPTGAISTNAARLSTFLAFVTPPLLILSLKLVLQGDAEYLTTACLLNIHLLFLFITARRYHKEIRQSLQRRQDNQTLVKELELNLSRLEDEVRHRAKTEADLTALTANLEQKVQERTSELEVLYKVSSALINPEKPLEEVFHELLEIMDRSSAIEKDCVTNIAYEGKVYQSKTYPNNADGETTPIIIEGEQRGQLSLAFPAAKAETQSAGLQKRDLLHAIAEKIEQFIELRLVKEHREEMERQLNLAHKMESIGQLAAGIAHEINTPTQFVTNNTQFLNEAFEAYGQALAQYQILITEAAEHPLNKDQIEQLKVRLEALDIHYLNAEIPEAISQSLDGLGRIAKIVQAMKDFSHPGGQGKTESDINRAINTSIDISRNEWKYVAELTTDLDPDLPLIPIYQNEFNQVILNLIVNAAHAIASQEFSQQNRGVIHISTQLNGDFVLIKVMDNGCGIPKDNQCRIFDHFFTTKEIGKGTGQGLAIAYAIIVDKHGGSIEVESELNQGSTFILQIPVRP